MLVSTIRGMDGCDDAQLRQKSVYFQMSVQCCEEVDIRLILVVVVKITCSPQMQLRRKHTGVGEGQLSENAF